MRRLLVLFLLATSPLFAQQGELANKQVGFPELNDTTTGTVLHGTAKITPLGTAILATTSDTTVPVYIVVGNAGTFGRAALSVNGYLAQCIMDGTASNTGGFYVVQSTSSNNRCHAQISQPAAGIWIIGFMADGSTANGGLANVNVNGQFVSSGGGGGGGLTAFNGRTAANVIPTLGDYTFSLLGGSAINSQLPGGGGTTVNGTSCFLGGSCAPPSAGTITINTIPCALNGSCTIPTGGGGVPTLPTTVNLNPWFLTSTPSSGVGQPAAWSLQGATGNVISGATSTYTFCGAITGVGQCTTISDNVNFPEHDSAATSRTTLTLPTPTTLQIPNFVTSYCNNAQVTNGSGDVIVPITWTINGQTNWPVFPGICERISIDPHVANNWLAVASGSQVSGKLYLEDFPATAGHVNLQACIDAAVQQHKICSTLNFSGATLNQAVQLDIGANGTNATLGSFGALELAPGLTITSTATTGVAFKHWHGFYIFGTGTPYNSAIFMMNGTASGLTSIWATDSPGGYYEASGFQINNTTASNPTSSGYSVELIGMLDSSFYRDVSFFDYTNKVVHVTHSCCSSGLYNDVIDGNYTSGDLLTLEYTTGVSVHGFGLGQMSIDHPACGAHHVVVHDTASPPHITATFYGPLYLENGSGGCGAPTVPAIDINGAGAVSFDLVESSPAQPTIQIENVSTPLVSVRAISNGATSAVTAINDLVTGGTGVTLTDTNGHAGPFTTGSEKVGNLNATGTIGIGPNPPACTPGTGFFICGNEGTTFTNAAGAAGFSWDSTTHEMLMKTNGASGSGMVVRAHPGSVHATGQAASISTATLCAATAGSCNVAGQYHVHIDLINTGTACSSIGSGSVAPTITWTDTNGTAHTAVPFPMITNVSGTALATSFVPTVSALTAWASGDMNISTNGTIIQYATTLTACGTGTLNYQIDASVTRMQ
jgi:hypothetical protein